MVSVGLLQRVLQNLLKEGIPVRDLPLILEALGENVTIVEADSANIKITRVSDVAIAEAILRSRSKLKQKGPLGPYAEAQW